ncbi:uncharacterized protein LOC112637997 [Camponotus floridanus]|uniref:uncharacterized protein LOC112637997 n=1 Tax=Camponotus floridanus TaxID=104421 RepID=UPI000DC6786B|nr:uncharacterized protein LOC112637997 [Camponotus floridanus]
MSELTDHERITLLMMRGWGDRRRSYNETLQIFNDTFRVGKVPISKSTVHRTIARFEEIGHVKNRSKSGRSVSATNAEKSLDVLQSYIENPHISIRKSAQHHDISRMSVHKILKKNEFHPYKIHPVQELSEDDFDRRVEFCEDVMQRIDMDPEFATKIVFSDEETFKLNGNINRHNCRFSDENPHWMIEAHTQHPEKLNVWTGLLADRVIGPFFIDDNLTAEKYRTMLERDIVPAIQRVGDNFNEIWFQQDGAPAHYGRGVREYLNEVFPNKWIGRRGSIEWPLRSPDLSPLDYFF